MEKLLAGARRARPQSARDIADGRLGKAPLAEDVAEGERFPVDNHATE